MKILQKGFIFSACIIFSFLSTGGFSQTIDDFEDNNRVVADNPYTPSNFPNNDLGGEWYCTRETGTFSHGSNSEVQSLEITSNGALSTTNCIYMEYLLGVSSGANNEYAFIELASELSSNLKEKDLSTNAIDFYIKGNENFTLKLLISPSNSKTVSKYGNDVYYTEFEVTTNWGRETLKFNSSTFHQGGYGSNVPFTNAVKEIVSLVWKEDASESGIKQQHKLWIDQIHLISSNVRITPEPSLQLPVNHFTFYNSMDDIAFKWSDESSKGVNLYQFCLSTVSNFSSYITGFPQTLLINTNFITNLETGSFYWRVRCSTNNGGSWGHWSETFHFVVSPISMHGVVIDLFEDNTPMVATNVYTDVNFPKDDLKGRMYCVDDSLSQVFSHGTATNSETLLFEIITNGGGNGTPHALHSEYILGSCNEANDEWSYVEMHMDLSSNRQQLWDLTGKGFDFWIKSSTNVKYRFQIIPPEGRGETNYGWDYYAADINATTNWQHVILGLDTTTFHQGGWGTSVPFTTAETEVIGIAWVREGEIPPNYRLHEELWVDQVFLLDSADRMPIITNLSAKQEVNSDKVIIQYTGIDLDGDDCTYVLQEFSTNGITWHTMTPDTNDTRHNKPLLNFTSSGKSFTYVWDASVDLPNPYCDKTVWIRIQVDDSHTASQIVKSPVFIYNSYPVHPTNLIISEVMVDPVQDGDWAMEWMEVYNRGDTCITINSNWRIGDLGGSHHSYVFTNSNPIIISAKSFGVFVIKLVDQFNPDFEQYWGNNTIIWGDNPATEDYSVLEYKNLTLDNWASSKEGVFIQYKPTGYINAVQITNVTAGHTWELRRANWQASSDTNAPSDVSTDPNWNICQVRGDTNGYPLSTDFGTPGKTNSQWTTSLPPIISNIVAIQTNDGSGKVIIRYIGTDIDNDICGYILAQYSTNNNDWNNMTADTGDVRHTSSPFLFTMSGTNITYIWNSKIDLPNIYDGTVWVRLQVNDGVNDSAISNSSAFLVDNEPPTPPNLVSPVSNILTNNTNLTFTWNASTDGSGSIDHYVIDVDDTSSGFGSIEQTASPSGTSQAFSLTEGTKYWRVRAYDATGNVSDYEVWIVNIDTTPPSAPVLSLPVDNTITNNNTPTLVWNTVGDAVDYEISIDGGAGVSTGGSTSYTPGALSEGAHTWTVCSIDSADNVGSYATAFNITIDTIAPNAPALSLPVDNTITNDNTPTLVWNAVGDAVSYIIRIDGVSVVTQSGTSYTPSSSLGEGAHTWTVCSIDSADNVGSYATAFNITIDTVAPNAPVLSLPVDTTITNDATPTLVWNTVGDAVDYEISIDGGAGVSTGGSTSYTPGALSEGAHTWTVRSIDSADNVGSYATAFTITIDTVAPNAPVLSLPVDNTITNDNTPLLVWNAVGDAVSYIIRIDGVSVVTQSGTSYTPSSSLGEGVHTWTVASIDNADNVGNFATAFNLTVDLSGPAVVSLISPSSNSTVASVDITFTWGVPTDTYSGIGGYILQVSENDSGFSSPTVISTNGTSVFLTGLTGGSTYYWRVKSYDDLGNTNNTWSSSWNINIDTNQIIPIPLSPSNGMISSEIMPTFVWSLEPGISSNQIVVDTITNTLDSITTNYTNGILSEGAHNWMVRVFKTSTGLWQSFSSLFTYIVDTTPPSNVTLLSLTNGSIITNNFADFIWTSATDSNGISRYELIIDSTNTNNCTVTNAFLSNLSEGNHTWAIVSIDVAGNKSGLSSINNFTIDTNSPVIPILLTPTNGTITSDNTPLFIWNSVSDLTGVHYKIVVGTNTNIVTGTNYIATTLSDGVFSWMVETIDGAGHHSGFSASFNFTILTSAPMIPTLFSPISNIHTTNFQNVLRWHSVSEAVTYNVNIDGSVINVLSTNFLQIFTEGLHTWSVEAINSVGIGSGYSSGWTIIIDRTAPTVNVVSPFDGNTLYTNTVVLSWTGSDISGVSNYIIQLSTNNFSTVFTNILQQNSFIELELPLNLYYWRIIAQDVLGNVGTNSIYQFTMRPYQASAYDIQVSDGIHIVDIPESLDSPKGKIAVNSVVLISFKLQGDANSDSDIQVKYNINENAKNGTFVQASWTGEEWVAELQGDSTDAQVGDVFYFKIISDGHIVENSGNTNGWGFEFGQIKDQENGVTIVNNAIRKESEDKVYIKYPITEKIKVSICVYNISGELVKKIVDGEQESGIHIAEWDGTNIKNQPVGRGIYLIVVKTDGKEIRKVIVR